MIKIYGSKMSFPVNKVLFLANYLKLDYEFIELNLMKGDHKKPEFMKIHPFGKVPAIDDNGFYLFESNTIMRYLATKADSCLYPKDMKEQMIVNQWLDFITNHMNQAMTRVAFNEIFAKKLSIADYDANSAKFGLELFDRFLPVLENHLSDPINKGALANSKLSIADFALFGTLEPCEAAGIDISKYTNLVKWRNEMRKQDWYKAVYENFESFVNDAITAKV
jgi:glutathione S-transferase